jgi:DNA-binding transcriptional LysR family regulator
VDHLRGDLSHYAESLVATVNVLANSAAITTFLPGELVSFLAAHPDINIDLEEHSSNQIVQAVTEERADIGIVADTADVGTLHHTTLGTDTLVLVTSVANPLAELDRISLEESLSQPFIGLTEGRTVEQHHESSTQPPGQRLNYRIRLPTIESVCQAVSAGVGVSVLPATAVQRWQGSHPVATVRLTDPWAERKLLLCTNNPATVSSPARTLIDHLTEHRTA